MTTMRAILTGFLLSFVAVPMFGATIVVNTTADTDAIDGGCSLREAIIAANANAAQNECPAGSGPDRIVFDLPSPSTILLTAALPILTETTLFRGPKDGNLAIDGNSTYRHFYFDSPGNNQWFGIEDLTLKNGGAPHAGSLYLFLSETLEATRVQFLDNRADNGGGAVFVLDDAVANFDTCTFKDNTSLGASGGGAMHLLDDAFVHVVDSTFVGNTSLANGPGGALYVNRAKLLLERSTLSGNGAANGGGGGIGAAATLTTSSATVTVIDSTIVDNTADAEGDTFGDGGGLRIVVAAGPVTLTLHNTIVAGNTAGTGSPNGADISLNSAVAIGEGSFNFLGVNNNGASQFPAGDPNVDGNFVGTSAEPLPLLLQPLANNGGPTLTHLPINDPSTRVIDHGECTGEIADQRGGGNVALGLRIVNTPSIPNHPGSDGCDIGAVERGGGELPHPELFADGFEAGHTLRWSTEVP